VPAPVEATRRGLWWVVPAVVVALVVVVFLVLAGAPYGRDEQKPVARTAATETIGEGDASTAASATLVEEQPATTTTVAVDTQPPPVIREEPPTAVIAQPTTTAAPPPTPREDVPPPPAPRVVEITTSQAMAILRGFITSNDYYGVGTACTGVRSNGYENVGYNLEVHDTCNPRLLGRWRVDAKTREVFRQREDGRYLRP
jgi:hypothetical protein